MDSKSAFNATDLSSFDSLLKEYATVAPEKLADLEHQRLDVIPKAVRGRSPPYVTKDELATLMDWKLAHGTFRPTLRKLIQQNDEHLVRTQTKAAFTLASDTASGQNTKALGALCKLKGVGPATASLILSTYNPKSLPFFSDELYRWAFFDSPPDGKGKGWDRQIKYTAKEWTALFDAVDTFRLRMAKLQGGNGTGPTALEVEKVAYVLGKRAKGGEAGAKTPGSKKRKMEMAEDVTAAKQKETSEKDAEVETARTMRASKRRRPS